MKQFLAIIGLIFSIAWCAGMIIWNIRTYRKDRRESLRRRIISWIAHERRWFPDQPAYLTREKIRKDLECYDSRWEKRYIEETLDELLGCRSVIPIEEDPLLSKYL